MAKTNSQQMLLDNGLISAAANSSISKVRSALDFGANINAQEADCGWCALHFAAYFSTMEKSAEKICKNLIAYGASVNIKATDGATPLLTAAAVGSPAAVAFLIAGESDVNLADHAGLTPLMAAADRGDEIIIDALLSAGADSALRDKRGMDAMGFAAKKGAHQIVSLIEAASIKSEICVGVRNRLRSTI